jgi:hypothetical protein
MVSFDLKNFSIFWFFVGQKNNSGNAMIRAVRFRLFFRPVLFECQQDEPVTLPYSGTCSLQSRAGQTSHLLLLR